ncbi:isochorismate synthase [Parabacteroides sp. PF5-5]|uniref:isochorismate synthase n=1 Tax=unclassified Parabacteroides TaxID=2649774 RepID=UPI002476C0FD|nr:MULTISPECIES: isochorismate synthase [unclassified Parabacteroides]MDH6304125.1 isochorismate synthase [Parabacteroides sp. PH5-39]MDH6315175.1 isochorismate synthase [Parabacteroides sp. PF5-13]MDH6318820.1 isochorismate synthase [Parabacteroides sp. PH5-13]MDH6322549.1 isochorismate synthase [Parabacteroides sp. PH5-8]MDH6326299.1 isochorismate synthase [Parabacteroides sp. PH5-41]
MSSEELHILDTYIGENRSFAIYRNPEEKTLHFLMQGEEPPTLLNTINELNGQKGFVIAPFAVSDNSPIVLMRPSIEKEIPFQGFAEKGKKGEKRKDTETGEDYAERFASFIHPIREKQFRKLVLSRSIDIPREEGFSPVRAFLHACSKYTRSYVYLCHTPQTGTWLGSTPEMLLCGEGNVWNTVAIAGTQPLLEGALPKSWDDKNLIEQMLVSFYIRTQLSSFGIHPAENGPYTVRAGELAHLRTDFHFSLPDTNLLGNLLKLLHPTPAVSGLPKEEAYRFILDHEGYNRRYYSGFIGQLDPEKKSDLYVNLRCMNIHSNSFTLYAGGGLLPSSVLEQEWKETEDKLQTMLYLTKADNYVF